MESKNAILDILDAYFAYPIGGGQQLTILRGISLRIYPGEIVGIVGANGAGKSTLLSIILGTLPLQSGRILPSPSGEHAGRQRLCATVVRQQALQSLAPTMTVFENYLTNAWRHEAPFAHAYSTARRRACAEWVGRGQVGLESRLDEQVRFLSGGQQQCLAVLLGLQWSGSLLLMDEPTASLDSQTASLILDLVKRTCEERGSSAIFVSHRFDHLRRIASRILVLSTGRIVKELHDPSACEDSVLVSAIYGIDTQRPL